MKLFLTFIIFSWQCLLFVAEPDASLIKLKNFVEQLPEKGFEEEIIMQLFRMPLEEVEKIHDLWGPLLDSQTFFDTRQLFACNYMRIMLQVEKDFKEQKYVRRDELNIKQAIKHATTRSTEFFDLERKRAIAQLVNVRLRLLEELENNL